MDPSAAALGSISLHLALLEGCEFLGKTNTKTGLCAHPLPAVPPSQQPPQPPALRAALGAEGHSPEEESRQGCPLTAQGGEHHPLQPFGVF